MGKAGRGFFEVGERYEKLIKEGLIGSIVFYQKAISPYLPHTCKFYPSCSEYSKEAILKHGALRGSLKALWRILRCNPLSKGGYDPVR